MRFRPASGGAGPASSRLALVLSSLALAPIAVLPPHVYANLPTGAQVVHGNVAITQAGGAMSIQQASRNAIVNWQSFNIGAGNSVRIEQGGAQAAMLARVVGSDPSKLMGSLKADGKLFLINPRGVIVGAGATIDTSAFMASTLDVSDADFIAGGGMMFKGDSDAGIVNLGRITAHEGNVLLFAHSVKNAGEIHAPQGTASLAAASEVYVASSEASSVVIKLNLPVSAETTGVENTGTIAAAQAELQAAGGSIYQVAINQAGIVRANGVQMKGGRVLLTADGGTVGVSGAVTATKADGSGGEVLIGGDYRGQNKDVPNAARTVVTKEAQIDVSATAAHADGGRAIVWAEESTRFLGALKASAGRAAGDGGFAEVSGKAFLDFNPRGAVDLSAANGRTGTLLLDPMALTISAAADSGTTTSGADPFEFGIETQPAVLSVTTLQNQLATSHVTIETSDVLGDVTFDAPVAWSSATTLRVNSFGEILINADITAPDGAFELYPGQVANRDVQEHQGEDHVSPRAILASGATVTVNRLTYGTNAAPAPAGWTSQGHGVSANFEGNLNVETLEIDLANGGTGVGVFGTNNTLGTVRTLGAGDLSSFYVENHHGDLSVQLDSSTATAPRITAITPGTLTLEAGSKLAFATPTDVVLASTSGGFINLAGATPFGNNARFLIYAADSKATSKGGLAGAIVTEHAFDPSDDFTGDTTNRFLFANDGSLPVLTYTADDLSRLYGAADPVFTATVTGLLGADLLAEVVTGLPVFSTTAVSNSGIGEYEINVASGTLASQDYDFTFAPGKLTIERAPLTITANDATRKVNRPDPEFRASYEGLVNGDTSSVISGLQFSTTATAGSPEGTYTITPFGATAANYTITFGEGTLTLSGFATLNIAANHASRLYGAADPEFKATITGFEDGDTESIVKDLKFSTNATQRSGVGLYTITPFGAAAPGYEINYQAGELTIERAPLTITANDASRKLHRPDPTFLASYDGFVNEDTSAVVSGLQFSTTALTSSPEGTYKITPFGATAANYAITFEEGTLTVAGVARLNIAANDASRLYGAANPAFTATMTGFEDGDDESVVTGLQFATEATQRSGIGVYEITPFGATTPGYEVEYVAGELTIERAPLTITADDASRRLNRSNPDFTASYSGLVNDDTPAVVSGLQFSTTAVGEVPEGSYAITPFGATAANYAITFQPGTLNVSGVATLNIAANDVTRLYGAANPAFTATITGFEDDEDESVVSGLKFATEATQRSGVGLYEIMPFGATAAGYEIDYEAGFLTIERAPLTITAASTSRIYGNENPAFWASFSGLLNDDTSAVVSGLTFATAATKRSNVGTYALNVSGGAADNYVITYAPGSVQITPATVVVKADDLTRVYGDPNPTPTITATGLKNDDQLADVVELVGPTHFATETSGIGAYGILLQGFSLSSNYVATIESGALTITPRPLTIVADNKTKVYGDPNPEFTATFRGLAPFDAATVIPDVTFSTQATQSSGVSTFGILVDSGLNPNYKIGYEFGSLSITPAPLSLLSPPDVSRVYGRADPALPSLNFGGLRNGDTAAGLRASYVDLPAPTADAGTYTYGVAIDNPNYQLTGRTTAIFRVDPAPLDVQISGTGRTYGDANPASYAFAAQGLAFGQTADSVLRVVNPTDATTGVGIYDLTAQLTSPNYFINSLTAGKFQINPRLLSFAIDNIARYYGDVDPEFTYTYGHDGLAAHDNVASIVSGFKTAEDINHLTNVGLYRIDPIFKANPNYLVSWVPGYMAILPRPITITVNNAIMFGNNHIPDGFTTAGTGVDLVRHEPDGRGNNYTGFTVTATNLPANITLQDIYPSMTFSLSQTNDPQRVVSAIDLASVFPKPAATTPQATTDPVAPSASGSTTFSSDAVKIADIPALFKTEVFAVIDGKLIKNPSAVELVMDRFADKTMYVSPGTLANSNYAVTQITNGLLVMKSDPEVVRINVEIALLKDQRAQARTLFENAGKTGAFGLPPDLFQMLFELLGYALNQELVAGAIGEDSLYYQVNGGPGDLYGDGRHGDKYLFWLADIHTNPMKQALLLPTLLTYAMDAANRPADKRSKMDVALVAHMTPYIQQAQEDFANQLKAEKEAWVKRQESAKGAADYMFGTADMYTEVIAGAVASVTKDSTKKISDEVARLLEDAKTTLTEEVSFDTDPTALLSYGGHVTTAGVALTLGMAAMKQYMNDASFGDFEAALRKMETSMNDDLKKSVSNVLESGGKQVTDVEADQIVKAYSARVVEQVGFEASSPDFQDKLNKAYDDALADNLKNGMSKAAAEKAAQEAKDAAHTKLIGEIVEKATKSATEEFAVQMQKLDAFAKSPELDEIGEKAAQRAFDTALAEGKSGQQALEISEQAKQAARSQAMSDKVGQLAEGFDSVDQIVRDMNVRALGGTEDIAQRIAAKAGSEAAEAGAKYASDAVMIGIKTAKMSAKLASLAKSLALGPAAIIDIVLEIGISAATSAAERADQEARLNSLIANGSKPVDVHAMAGNTDGRAIMMMGLLKMFSAP
jgi:filamentous haemagglutinin family N-terminal domain